MEPDARLAVLEQRVEHLERQIDAMALQVAEMHGALMQAKGVKLALVVLATVVVATIGPLVTWLLHRGT